MFYFILDMFCVNNLVLKLILNVAINSNSYQGFSISCKLLHFDTLILIKLYSVI